MRVRALPLERALSACSAAEELVVDAGVEPTPAESLELAARGGVSACDELDFVAERLDLVLVTADRKLVAAFPGRVRSIREYADGAQGGALGHQPVGEVSVSRRIPEAVAQCRRGGAASATPTPGSG